MVFNSKTFKLFFQSWGTAIRFTETFLTFSIVPYDIATEPQSKVIGTATKCANRSNDGYSCSNLYNHVTANLIKYFPTETLTYVSIKCTLQCVGKILGGSEPTRMYILKTSSIYLKIGSCTADLPDIILTSFPSPAPYFCFVLWMM